MRCGCPQCGTYMIQSEGLDVCCVCPQCLYRCRACMGTNTVVSRENLKNLALTGLMAEQQTPDDGEEAACPGECERGPLRPEDFVD